MRFSSCVILLFILCYIFKLFKYKFVHIPALNIDGQSMRVNQKIGVYNQHPNTLRNLVRNASKKKKIINNYIITPARINFAKKNDDELLTDLTNTFFLPF